MSDVPHEPRQPPESMTQVVGDFRRLITLELEIFEEQYKIRAPSMKRAPSEWLAEFSVWRKFR